MHLQAIAVLVNNVNRADQLSILVKDIHLDKPDQSCYCLLRSALSPFNSFYDRHRVRIVLRGHPFLPKVDGQVKRLIGHNPSHHFAILYGEDKRLNRCALPSCRRDAKGRLHMFPV